MEKLRSNAARYLAIGLGLAMVSSVAFSAEYPNQPIKIVVPFAAGGPTDTYARLIGQKLSEAWDQPVVIENKPGATGLIGSNTVKEAAPDGYTLLFTSNSAQVISPLLHSPPLFDPIADFTPIGMVLRYPMYFLINSKSPAKSLSEFIDLAKANPGKYNYSSVGIGSGGHLGCELINIAAGIDTVHVAYKGAAPARTALVAGEVDYMCDSVGFSQPLVKEGKLRGLAVTSKERSDAVPDVPTVAEQGIPGVETYIWTAFFGPKGMPDPIVQKLNAEIKRIAQLPEIKARAKTEGSDVVGGSSQELIDTIAGEKEQWRKVIEEKNIEAN